MEMNAQAFETADPVVATIFSHPDAVKWLLSPETPRPPPFPITRNVIRTRFEILPDSRSEHEQPSVAVENVKYFHHIDKNFAFATTYEDKRKRVLGGSSDRLVPEESFVSRLVVALGDNGIKMLHTARMRDGSTSVTSNYVWLENPGEDHKVETRVSIVGPDGKLRLRVCHRVKRQCPFCYLAGEACDCPFSYRREFLPQFHSTGKSLDDFLNVYSAFMNHYANVTTTVQLPDGSLSTKHAVGQVFATRESQGLFDIVQRNITGGCVARIGLGRMSETYFADEVHEAYEDVLHSPEYAFRLDHNGVVDLFLISIGMPVCSTLEKATPVNSENRSLRTPSYSSRTGSTPDTTDKPSPSIHTIEKPSPSMHSTEKPSDIPLSRLPAQCPICEKMISRRMDLGRHIKLIHKTAEKKHECSICGKNFKMLHHLKGHVDAVHKAIKPFECLVCGHRTSKSNDLKKHMASHK